MVVVLVAIVLVAVAIYATVLFLQRSYDERIAAAKNEIEKLVETPLETELVTVEALNLSGDSLEEFTQVKHDYHALVNQQLPELSEHLNELQAKVQNYQLLKLTSELKAREQQVALATAQYEELKEKLVELKQTAEIHKKAITERQEEYQAIRKTLLAKNFSYGPSIDKLEAELAALEKDFDKYAQVTQAGDFVSSNELLNSLEQKTNVLKTALKKLPPIYRNFKNIFPEQLTELKTGLAQLTKEKFAFKEDVSQKLTQIEKLLKEDEEYLKAADVPKAETCDQQLADLIDSAYEVMETEYDAKVKVTRQEEHFAEFLKHAQHQEKELLIELDRLSQNYTLNHNELEDARTLDDQLKEISQRFDAYLAAKDKSPLVYSQILTEQTKDLESLTKIEEEQKKISESVADLFEEEKEAVAAVQGFDNDIHRLKREVENLNLPGLPSDYVEYFFKVGDEIEQLDRDLNKIQLDMEQIAHDLINTQSDLDVLTQKTQEIIDSSALTEEMLQYANRYRNKYPEVATAYSQAYELFAREYDYMGALDTISEALETVEPGCYKRIENNYKESSKRRAVV